MTKPVVGLNADLGQSADGVPRLHLRTDYFDAVQAVGGLPLVIPFLDDAADIEQALDAVDALLLTGGADLDLALFGRLVHPKAKPTPERRQRFDVALARAALARGTPVLAICMGMQLINVVGGGTLVQDLDNVGGRARNHRGLKGDAAVHDVAIVPGSRLERIIGGAPLRVNSTHHQAVDSLASGFRVSARSPDSVIEATEGDGPAPVLGVQWHPERLLNDPRQVKLFNWLVRQADKRRAAT